jgi:hypothetical protein
MYSETLCVSQKEKEKEREKINRCYRDSGTLCPIPVEGLISWEK